MHAHKRYPSTLFHTASQARYPFMIEPQAIDRRAIGLMVILCLIWGLQQVAIKVIADDIAPIMQIALRSAVAVVLVGLLIWTRREKINWAEGYWKPGILVGILFGLEYLLVGEGLRHTTASHMAVFLYTASHCGWMAV